MSYSSSNNSNNRPEKVCIVGSGNWGSAIAITIGRNAMKHAIFNKKVTMWVFEETVNNRKLTDIINTDHENVKYLPGMKLPENIRAEPELKVAAKDATLLVFVVPHQFVKGICEKLVGVVSPKCRAISLIKGFDASKKGIILMSDLINQYLKIDVCTLSGANIADEVAKEAFCETTIGYKNRANGEVFFKLFDMPYFRCQIVEDVYGVELCGALKNVVALAAGFSDGLKFGSNTKAAFIRIGLQEMRDICKLIKGRSVKDQTFFESCGVADLITTCYGGRNRKCAEAHVVTGKSFDVLEKEMLNGQKLQGTLTSKEVYDYLKSVNKVDKFPLFRNVYKICFEGQPAKSVLTGL